MKTPVIVASALLTLSGCAAMQEDPEIEEEIELDAVPPAIMSAAQLAVPGIEIDEAEFEEEDGAMIYELEGMLGEQRYEIEIGQDGKILELEEVDVEDEEDDA